MKITRYIDDICITSGLAAIVTATFLWSIIGGIYVLGGCLLGLGVYFARYPIKGGEKSK